MRHNNPDEWYYAFRIEKWNDLPSPILIKNETVYKPRYTNLFLLQNSVDTNELFNTHSSEEYRLMYELRQVISSADTYAVYRLNGGKTVHIRLGYIDIKSESGESLLDSPISVSELSHRIKYYSDLIRLN